ncbi:platelet binding protein GspB isoform X2 [Paralichthys olivaceus]|uniref:platelet binding protein GspB isoform X2 n=1 Tax=Paralichthys olivaceus TaxID=8255 RepID=UPI0037506FE0
MLQLNPTHTHTRRLLILTSSSSSSPSADHRLSLTGEPAALKPASSEAELCQADSLGSAGSSSTLASSVIEVEAERAELGLSEPLRSKNEDKEEEDEELTPLIPPPTLSITEEILEFINQSRAREGLASIHTDTMEQVLDELKESQSPTHQTNFTCPLPPVACPSSPEQRTSGQEEKGSSGMEEDGPLHSPTGGSADENKTTTEVKEIPDATSEVEMVEADGEKEGEGVEEDKDEEKTWDEGEGVTPAPTSDLHSSTSAEEKRESGGSCNSPTEKENNEVATSLQSSDPLLHPIQRRQPPTRRSHLTKRDKKIIEKIRSYYEAAAEAGEEEAEEEEEQGEGVAGRRRNSFSQIPSGLVKESVSRFDVSGHQGEPESGQSMSETISGGTDGETDLCFFTGPISCPTPLSAVAESDGQADKPISSLDSDADAPIETPASTMMQDQQTPNQAGENLQQNQPVGEESETQDNVCNGLLEEEYLKDKQEGQTSVVTTGRQNGLSLQVDSCSEIVPSISTQDETTCPENQAVVNGCEKTGAIESKGSCKEPSTPSHTEQHLKTETSSKHRELAKPSGNLECLPSQIKVGRWSRHSRIVTANRALFEGMGSDVASFGLFESGPSVDSVLIENSERILSKVQTLARMYSAKASTMKVPLHQKRAYGAWNQSWGSGALNWTGHSTQTHTRSQQQVQSQAQKQIPAQRWQQTQDQMITNQSVTKTGTHTQSETKVQSQTTTQSRKQQTNFLNQTKICSQNQTLNTENQRIQEERMIKRALTNDPQGTTTSARHHQTNEFTLSRPRDFISALTKERDFSLGDNSQTSTSAVENQSTALRDQSSSQAHEVSPGSRHQLSAPTGDQSTALCCSDTNNPSTSTMTLDRSIPEFRDVSSSTGRGGALNQNRAFHTDTEATERKEGLEQSAGHPVYSVREDTTFSNILTKTAHKFNQDTPATQDKETPGCKSSTGHLENKDSLAKDVLSLHTGPDDLVCTKNMDREALPGELVVGVASTQIQSPAKNLGSKVPHQGEQSHLQEECSTSSGTSGGPKIDELPNNQMESIETNNSSSQSKMIVQGSTLTFSEEPPYTREIVIPAHLRQPLHVTFDPFLASSHAFTESQEDRKAGEGAAPSPWCSPSVQSIDCLPTFTSQRPPDLPTTLGKQAPSNSWNVSGIIPCEYREQHQQDFTCPQSRPSLGTTSLVERSNQAIAAHTYDTELSTAPSAFRPSLRHSSPSPVRNCPTSPRPTSSSAIRAPPCSSPSRVVPAPSPTSVSVDGFTSPNMFSGALSCLSPTPSSGRVSSMRVPLASSPTPTAFTPSFSPSSSGRSSSVRAGLPSSPTLSSSLRSSPIASSSAFTRSLAASCISQSISQSMAKKNTVRQQAPPMKSINPRPSSTPSLPSSHLQQRSPSPKLPHSHQSCSTPAHVQPGCNKDAYQHPRCPPSSLQSSCPSLSPHLPPHSLSHRSPSPSTSMVHYQSTHSSVHPSFLQSQMDSLQNGNNNNNIRLAGLTTKTSNVVNTSGTSGADNTGVWPGSPQKAPLANHSTNARAMQQMHDSLWSGSHNRVAQPFSASEPSSRVQSPSPSPTPASLTRLYSPPPQHNYSSPMANKPPHPRSTRAGGTSSHNPLGLSLELPTSSSASLAFVHSSSCLSPRILSPPPIGVSVNVWTNNVAAPQPRNPRFASASPSSPFSSSSMLTSSTVPLHSPRAPSPSGPCPTASRMTSQTLRRSFSSNLADRPPSPVRSNSSGRRLSWAESSCRSFGFSGNGRGSFDQQESCPPSPRSGWSSYNSSPPCISPQPGLQSPLSHSRLSPGKGTLGGQHFTSVPWPDVQELSSKYNGTDGLDSSAPYTVITSSPSPLSHSVLYSPTPSDSHKEWGDPDVKEGNCRSQLICAYVSRPFHEQTLSSSCLALSSSGMTSPPLTSHQYQVKPEPQVQMAIKPPPSNHSPLPPSSSPIKSENLKTNYATTVNLQIAGSGRITSFSTAQVSLTQTLQGRTGAGAGAEGGGGSGHGQTVRRLSINGHSHMQPPQNCNRL